MSVITGAKRPSAFEHQVILWLGPYVAGRLATRKLGVRSVGRVIVLGGALIAPFLLIEAAAHVNVFTRFFPSAIVTGAGLGTSTIRLGATRIEGSFGQPIPMAMFLSSAAILALGLALSAKTTRDRRGWTIAAAAFALLQTDTLSRIGYVMLAVGLMWLGATRTRALLSPARVSAVAVALAVAFAVGALAPVTALLGGNGNAGLAASAEYRSALITYAERPGILRPFGSSTAFIGPGNNTSIDDEYILLATGWGIVAVVSFLGILAATVLTGWRSRTDSAAAPLFAATIASFVALYGVALFAQEQYVVWFLIGACSGATTALPAAARAHAASGRSSATSELVAGPAP
jgi:hypothetical protein